MYFILCVFVWKTDGNNILNMYTDILKIYI